VFHPEQFFPQLTPRLDLHTILKTCYFADKDHLNRNRRPIFGATYRAMRFGPVPLETYEMTKRDPIWLPELDADSYPWSLEGQTYLSFRPPTWKH
jgi:hypothetical protein